MLGMRLKEGSVSKQTMRQKEGCLMCGRKRADGMNVCQDCHEDLTGKSKSYGRNAQTMLHDDIGDLVRFKKNLRWRKWPEETPEPSTGCIGIIDINPHAYILCRYQDGQFIFPASMQYEISYWLPLSALPAVEEDTK